MKQRLLLSLSTSVLKQTGTLKSYRRNRPQPNDKTLKCHARNQNDSIQTCIIVIEERNRKVFYAVNELPVNLKKSILLDYVDVIVNKKERKETHEASKEFGEQGT
ncbi:unnamed protein product [Trichobilharzia regenti]|nr:unnamed protein product [Trichobilharzia regenti]